MIRRLLALSACICFSQTSLAQDCSHGRIEEKLGAQEAPFTIKYSDGTAENVIVKYTAHAARTVTQSGTSNKHGLGIDDRKCHWGTEAYIHRQVCVVSRSLGEQCDGSDNKIFNLATSASGKSLDIFEGRFQGENCNRACGKFNNEFGAAKKLANDQLSAVFAEDYTPFLQRVRQRPQVSAVVDSSR